MPETTTVLAGMGVSLWFGCVGWEFDLQEAETEDTDEEHPLLLCEVQFPEGGERQDEHGNIGDDVTAGVDVPLREVRDALGVDGLVPEPADGGASENAHECLGGRPASDDNDCNDVDHPHVLDRQDAVILEEKCEFDEK